ncbi:hypothetical protein D0Z07_4368 [Hyphodiscus hymeniophilus]|uniref:2EXR domain-containing protein n=1 Tax=Hyphodiscus hymeniophilus TaxID=353542 RepID=A0A9P7AXJ3_9HELO|nr:hypothetical protein D0Z07_4368 [Hyphodiscus hymeniophilus]
MQATTFCTSDHQISFIGRTKAKHYKTSLSQQVMDSNEAPTRVGPSQESAATEAPVPGGDAALALTLVGSSHASGSSRWCHIHHVAHDTGSVGKPYDESLDGIHSCDCASQPISPPPGGPTPPTTKLEPFLTSFASFLKLPIEIQEMIWDHTLEPRTLEIEYGFQQGFHTRAKTPIALRACPQSRKAVSKAYHTSFGSLLHKPNIVFNPSLDTLYFDAQIQPRLTQFLVSMTKAETESIQYIAVDRLIDEDVGYDYVSEDNGMESLKIASQAMTSLKNVFIVYNMDYNDFEVPSGSGPMEIFEEPPYDLQVFMWESGLHFQLDSNFLELLVPTKIDEEFASGFDAELVSNIFGWRSTDLPEVITPFWLDRSLDI